MKPTTVSPSPAAAAAATDDPSSSHSDPASATFSVERRGDASASCRWTLPDFARTRARNFYSRYFEVGGFDCRLLLYPRGDAHALPGHLSLYLQVLDPKTPSSSSSSTTTTSSSKWDCFLSYRLTVVHPSDNSKSLARDSWHRFSSKKRAHGWADFAPSATASFLWPPHDSLVIAADISVLSETASFAEADGRFTWKMSNFGLFREMIRTHKIMSPAFFPAAAAAGGSDCGIRISLYQTNVSGADHLSVCLEGKEPVVQATSASSASALASTSAGSGVPDDRGCCQMQPGYGNQFGHLPPQSMPMPGMQFAGMQPSPMPGAQPGMMYAQQMPGAQYGGMPQQQMYGRQMASQYAYVQQSAAQYYNQGRPMYGYPGTNDLSQSMYGLSMQNSSYAGMNSSYQTTPSSSTSMAQPMRPSKPEDKLFGDLLSIAKTKQNRA